MRSLRHAVSPRPLSTSIARLSSRAVLSAVLALATASAARAANLTWEPDGVLGNPIGGTGAWNTTDAFWDDAGILRAWINANNDTAIFGLSGVTTPPPHTVTLGTAITAGGLTFNASNYTVTGNTLTLAGTPVISLSNEGHAARINSILAGSAGLSTAGPLLGTSTLYLGGANIFAGVATIGSGSLVVATNASALGAGGAGNGTVIQSGGTFNTGSLLFGTEQFTIAGTGTAGQGALINEGPNNATNAANITKLTLSANATVNAGGNVPAAINAGGVIQTSSGGRLDFRNLTAAGAGTASLDLAGFTLTKKGANQLVIVHHDISNGNIVVDEGALVLEAGTLVQGTGSITVNQNGRLGFWGLTGTGNITRPITVNGGTIGEVSGSSASQTIGSPITLATAVSPNFVASSNTTTFSGLISKDAGATFAEVAKRGTQVVAFSHQGNSFDVPVAIYSGNLQANFTAAFAGGTTTAPIALTGTPLGANGTVKLMGGTLAIRVDGANSSANEFFSIGKSITVDRAPSGINLGQLGTNTASTDKNLVTSSVTFLPSSASNGYSIGQNQLQMTQGNSYRLIFGGTTTLNNDTVLNVGDFTFSGNTISANRNSLLHIGGNSWGFVGGTHEFGSIFNVGGAQLRIGAMYGTPVTSDTVTAGTGTIFTGPNNSVSFRSATNIASGQLIDLVSHRTGLASAHFQNFTSIPANVRAAGSGAIGIGGATNFGDLDLSRLGDGTFRILSNLGGSGNGTITGVISPGAGNVVRVGGVNATSVLTISGTNRITGSAALEVGSDLINAGFRQTQASSINGIALLGGANDYTGGTTVNRSSTLRFQASGSLGTAAANVFGTLAAEGASGSFITPGGTNLPVNIYGGSTVRLDSSALTTTVDVDRWENSTPISLLNATLQLDARNSNSTTTETVGTISFAGGSFLSLQRNNASASSIVQLQTPSLTRVGNGTLEITRSGSSSFSTNVRLLTTVTEPPVVNGMISPSIMLNDPTRHQNFANYTTANGIENASFTAVIKTGATPGIFDPGLLNTGIYHVDFATANTTLTLADNPVLYALKLGGGTAATTLASAGANNTVTLRSGGLIFSSDNGVTTPFSTDGTRAVNFNANLVANNGAANIEAFINTRNAFTANVTGTVTANGLTKFGAGTLNLFANNGATLAGNVAVNHGTLQVFGPTATSIFNTLGTGLITLQGGQLNLRSNNSAVTGTINQTLQNGLVVAPNIPIATLDVNRSGADTASTGTFIFNPVAAGSTGLQLQGSPGVQGQTFTVSGGTYGVQFGDNAVNSFAGNVTMNNGVTVTLNNAPAITGTNPIFTKAGGGNLILGATSGTTAVASGTQAVINGGTLELRHETSLGTGATTTLVLNNGTLNLRSNTATTFGGAGTGYTTVLNGNSTISVDRIASGNLNLSLGNLVANGNATLTVNHGNNYGLVFANVQLNGTPFFTSNIGGIQNVDTALRVNGAISGGALVKQGGGHMHLLGANSTYDGGTHLFQGITRARAAGALGTGTVYLDPGAVIDFNANNNLNAGQAMVIRGSSAFAPMVSVSASGVLHPTANVDASGAARGIVGLSNTQGGTYNDVINMSQLYGGRWHLGGISTGAYDARYTASSLGAGAGNVYRFGGGGSAVLIGFTSAGVAQNNVLSGNNEAEFGFDSATILPFAAPSWQFAVGGTNNYAGDTVIHRGMVVRLATAQSGGFTGLSNTAVDVFGSLHLGSTASMVNAGAATNAVTLHPGATLQFDNNATVGNGAASNVSNRWNDTTFINMSGALLELMGNNNNASTETVGDVGYAGAARFRVARTGTGTATLTLNSLGAATAKGNQVFVQTSAASTLGGVDKLMVTNGAPSPVNAMLGAGFINATDNTFLTYGGANGFANIAYDRTLNATYTAGSLLPNDKVDVGTGALTLTDNPTVYALRTSQSINISGGNTLLTIRSGGLINTGTVTIGANIAFKDGPQAVEGVIHTAANLTLNGALTADGIVKSGNGQLIVNTPQPGLAGGWVLNSGDIIFNDPGAAGQSVAGNAITINATQTHSGQSTQALTRSRVVFQRDNGTSEVVTFSGGPITVRNEGDISILANNDRQVQIPNVTAVSTGTAASASLTFDVRFSRFRGIIPTLTLASDTTARVYDATSTLTTGSWTNAAVGSLVGANVRLHKIGNRTLELSGDNTATFIGGSINVSQGALRVMHAGSLGTGTTTNIERNAALEIGVADFAPVGLTQEAGSIERWNLENARGTGNYLVPAGVNLQLNTNLVGATARTITLQGGSIEGFLYTDHVAQADQRTVGQAVTLNLASNSLVGQNILNGVNYDAGRAPTVAQPFADTYTGSYLRIEGKITGAGNLTKTGLDTVTIAPAAGITNDYGDTTVEMGVLRIGAADALPTGKVLTTRNGGQFDIYGFDQTVAGLGVNDSVSGPGGTGVDVAGRITNSGVTEKILTVNNGANFTYNGVIERNLSLVKSGVGTLTLGGANTHLGATLVNGGTLRVNGSISGATAVNNGGTLSGTGKVGTLTLNAGGTLAPGAGPGILNAGDTFFSGGTFSLELNGVTAGSGYDQLNVTGGVSFLANTPLSISLGFTPVNDGSMSFVIVNNDASDALGLGAGLFSFGGNSLPEGATFDTAGHMFQITYAGGTGNDVVLTAVPEPGTGVVLLAGMAAMAGLRRSRRRN